LKTDVAEETEMRFHYFSTKEVGAGERSDFTVPRIGSFNFSSRGKKGR